MSSEVLHFPPADHFPDPQARRRAAHLGMWLFLATEVLLFAGLFIAYGGYHLLFPAGFHEGSRHLDLAAGTLNTFLLITSSLLVALSLHEVRAGRTTRGSAALAAAFVLGAAFLAVKGFEYHHHWSLGALPGRWYRGDPGSPPGTSLFFTVYFLSTGLHALHVTAGLMVLAVLAVRLRRTTVNRAYDVPLELGGMYWHLVDVIWIFLFPLLYLVG